MGALIPIRPGVPPARANLVSLNEQIADAERRLDVLRLGHRRLESELARASDAKAELASLVDADAKSLVDRLRSGGQWLLSSFGSSCARELALQLPASRFEATVGERALEAAAGEIVALERELSDLKQRRPNAIAAVMIEAGAGWREDLAAAIDDMRQAMTILSALDRVVARSDGSYSPTHRIAIEIPAVGTMPARTLVCPAMSIDNAAAILRGFAKDLEREPLADIESLVFPHCNGTEDSSTTVYADLSRVERQAIDMEHALGVN
jgi:hypothetical protein